MTGGSPTGGPSFLAFSLAGQRYIQKSASLLEFFILESYLKDCHAPELEPNFRGTVTVLPMHILRLRRAAHLHLTLQGPASRMPRDRAFGVCCLLRACLSE
jgi:hypothetical protein